MTKLFPRYPVLVCLKKTGPGDTILISIAVSRKSGEKNSRPRIDPTKSSGLFQRGIGGAVRFFGFSLKEEAGGTVVGMHE